MFSCGGYCPPPPPRSVDTTGLLGETGRKTDKRHERGRGAEKCVGEHWVTLLLNLSTSKVSPQAGGGGGGVGRGDKGVARGKVSGGRVREKRERFRRR